MRGLPRFRNEFNKFNKTSRMLDSIYHMTLGSFGDYFKEYTITGSISLFLFKFKSLLKNNRQKNKTRALVCVCGGGGGA